MAHAEKGLDIEEGIGPQEIDAGPVSVVVIFGAVTTVILIFLTILFFRYMQGVILETKGMDEPNEKVVQVVSEQRKQLTGYHMVDAKKGIVQIPIETAMAMIVEQRTKDPNPKITPPPPQGAKPGEAAPNKDASKSAAKTDPTGKQAVDQAKVDEAKKKDAPKTGAKGNEKH